MLKDIFELFVTDKVKFCSELHVNEGNKNLYFFIESYGFKGHGPIYLLKDDIKKYIQQLELMSNTFVGECCIEDTESTGYIKVFFKGRELFVRGSISDYSTHTLTFEFGVDQTLLIPFTKVLEQLL